jgi:hypothetical protein
MIENPFHQKCYVITSSALCNLQVLFYAAFTLFFDTPTGQRLLLALLMLLPIWALLLWSMN